MGTLQNVSHCVKLKERIIREMKSHDSHILMQQLLLVALCSSIPKNIVEPLI
jgi:hypothetical protein